MARMKRETDNSIPTLYLILLLQAFLFVQKILGKNSGNETRASIEETSGGQTTPVASGPFEGQGHLCSPFIFSCQGRCNAESTSTCSCSPTCVVYGNCCEDYEDFCVPSSDTTRYRAQDFKVSCIANSLLISSCSASFLKAFSENTIKAAGKHSELNQKSPNLMKRILKLKPSFNTLDVVSFCEETSPTNITTQAPVTDTQSLLHYKNIFCAACNNATSVSLWTGFLKCKNNGNDNTTNTINNSNHHNNNNNHSSSSNNNNSSSNSNSSADSDVNSDDSAWTFTLSHLSLTFDDVNMTKLSTASKTLIFADTECQLLWYPAFGNPNRCVPDDELNHDVDSAVESGGRWTQDPSENVNDTISLGNMLRNTNVSAHASLYLEWQDVEADNGDLDPEEMDRKCRELTSFVEHPWRSGNIYKNKYCYMAQHNYTGRDMTLCAANLKTVDKGERWYTLKTLEAELLGDATSWPTNEIWHLYSGIETAYKDAFVQEQRSQTCDWRYDIVKDGKCLKKSFILRFNVNYTFKHSNLFKGDFQKQAESYSDLIVETTTGRLFNSTYCISLYRQMMKVTTSHYEYTSEVEFECAENLATTSGHESLHLVDGNVVRSKKVNRYIDFVSAVLDTVIGTKKAVSVPVTITLEPCIFVVNGDVVSMERICSTVRSVWKAVRHVDAIVGGLSLEGIITVICCALSDIGLLVRLALQNVVPFYKSYPGKIQFSLCLSLLLAYTLFLIGGAVKEGSTFCKVIAILTHLAFLSALFWMNVTAFEIWRTFRHWRNQVVSRGYVSFILSIFYAVGIPAMYVATAIILERVVPTSEISPSYGEHNCWLNGSMAVAVFFVIPCSFICCMNVIFVGLTLRGLRRQRTSISEFKKSNTKTTVTDMAIVVKIILLVGITWLLGLLAALVDSQALWIIFTIINASLGFMISCVLVINKRVYYTIHNKCLCYTVESTAVVSTQVPRH